MINIHGSSPFVIQMKDLLDQDGFIIVQHFDSEFFIWNNVFREIHFGYIFGEMQGSTRALDISCTTGERYWDQFDQCIVESRAFSWEEITCND